MADVVVTSPAVNDVDDILFYLLRHGGQAAVDSRRSKFEAAIRFLGTFPRIGAPRPRLGRGIRLLVASPYVVLHRYEPASDTVFVLRILHGRRRLSLDAP